MAKLNVNPTRMELSRLKIRLKTAVRGHKLLKDKQDELMRQFIDMIKKNKKLREKVEEMLQNSFKDFLLSRGVMSDEMLENAIAYPKEKIGVEVKKKNIMSVNVPQMTFVRENEGNQGMIYPYGYAQTSADLDDAIDGLSSVMDNLLERLKWKKLVSLWQMKLRKLDVV